MNTYNADFEPPALCVNVTIANTTNRRKRSTLNALLDTGSDITAIPSEQVRLLDLYTRTQIRLETVEGTSSVIQQIAGKAAAQRVAQRLCQNFEQGKRAIFDLHQRGSVTLCLAC